MDLPPEVQACLAQLCDLVSKVQTWNSADDDEPVCDPTDFACLVLMLDMACGKVTHICVSGPGAGPDDPPVSKMFPIGECETLGCVVETKDCTLDGQDVLLIATDVHSTITGVSTGSGLMVLDSAGDPIDPSDYDRVRCCGGDFCDFESRISESVFVGDVAGYHCGPDGELDGDLQTWLGIDNQGVGTANPTYADDATLGAIIAIQGDCESYSICFDFEDAQVIDPTDATVHNGVYVILHDSVGTSIAPSPTANGSQVTIVPQVDSCDDTHLFLATDQLCWDNLPAGTYSLSVLYLSGASFLTNPTITVGGNP